MGKKSTKVQKEAILKKVQGFLLSGETRASIVRKIGEEYGISPRAVDKHIKTVKDELVELSKEDRGNQLAIHLQKLNHLFKKAYSKNDLRACVQILKEDGLLRGLYEINKKPLELEVTETVIFVDDVED